MPRVPERAAAAAPVPADASMLLDGWNRVLFTLAPLGDVPAPAPRGVRVTEQPRIPVTVLSGFLGAGKTTLLCRLLDEAPASILAIVNDLAAVNIDAAQVRARSAGTIQLQNGCACCVLGNDLDALLTEIGARDERPERIVLEASGIADPMGLAQAIASNAATVLDGIVTLVAAGDVARLRTDAHAAALFDRQLDAAHIVLLTKAEANRELEALRREVGALAPGRPVFALHEISTGVSEVLLGATLRGARPPPPHLAHDYSGFAAQVIECGSPVHTQSLCALLERIPDCVYRLKGWLQVQDAHGCAFREVQAAGPRWRLAPCSCDVAHGELVVIGRAGDREFTAFCAEMRALVAS